MRHRAHSSVALRRAGPRGAMLLKAIVVILAAFQFCAPSKAATRIAIVGTDAAAETSKVLDLAIAEFKDSKDIEVLERAQIDRALREQELSLAVGVSGAERAVKAGRVLRVDLFAVLEGGKPREPFGVVVFDAQTGVRYADSAVTGSSLPAAASAVGNVIQQAVEKLRQRSGNLLTVGVLSVRNADLARSFDPLCDGVALLLERELARAPGVAVLERRRLEHINRERGVVDDAGTALLPSLRMLDLEISRYGDGLRASVSLTSFDGQWKARTNASVATMDAATLAHCLAGALTRLLLQQSLTVQPDRIAEAQRFGREGDLLASHQDYLAAARVMEAAHALDPTNQFYPYRITRLLPDAAIEMIDSGGQHAQRRLTQKVTEDDLAQALSLAHRGADLLKEQCAALAAVTAAREPVPDVMGANGSLQLARLLQKLNDPGLRDGALREDIAALAGKERFIRIEVIEPFLRQRARDKASFDHYSWASHWLAYYEALGAWDRERWQHDAASVTERWLEVAKKLNPPDGSGNYAPLSYLIPAGASAVTDAPELFAPIWKACENTSDPVLRAYGKFGPAMRELKAVKHPDIGASRHLRLWLQGEIERLSGVETNARPRLFSMIEQALLPVLNHPQYGEECVAACRFALQQRAARPVLFRTAIPFFRGAEGRPLASDISRMITERPKDFPDLERNQIATLCRPLLDPKVSGGPVQSVSMGQSLEAVKLFEPSPQRDGMGWLLKVFAADGVVYAAGLGLDDQDPQTETIQLMRVPLDGQPATRLGRAPFRGVVLPQIHKFAESAWQRGAARISSIQLQAANLRFAACAAAGKCFVATHVGVFIFPTNGGGAELLCGTNGLPSDDVHSLAFLDGKLYIGAGELKRAGYLAEYDPATKAVKTLASSRRREALSPFDNQAPIFPKFLWADEARGRVLMLAGTYGSNALSGLWSFTPASGRFEQLASMQFHVFLTYSMWGGEAAPNVVAAFHSTGISLWDAQADRFILNFERAHEQESPLWPELSLNGKRILYPPVLLHEGWLWWANPLQRVSLDGKKLERFPPLAGWDESRRHECLQLLDEGRRMLLADRSAVWMLNLRAGESPSVLDTQPGKTSNSK